MTSSEGGYHLKAGSALKHYRIIRVLGEGSFGITYLAQDSQLGIQVVIKEYFPNEFAIRADERTITAKTKSADAYRRGMQRFKEEAQTLARFNHPSIVKILAYFEENSTAYFVMEYEEGTDLSEYIKQHGTPFSQEEILSILMPVLEGLKEVHKHNFLHRDIKPGNILMRKNSTPVLIDFGASKLAIGEASRSITSMLTEGYAPLEQYSTDIKRQGPFTDLYAIAAMMYKMITGEVPPSAQTRSFQLLQGEGDPYRPLLELLPKGYEKSFLSTIDRALSMKSLERPQSVQAFQQSITGMAPTAPAKTSEGALREAEHRGGGNGTVQAKPVKKSHKGTFWVLGVSIVVVAATLAYMLLQKQESVPNPKSVQPVPVAAPASVKEILQKQNEETLKQVAKARAQAEAAQREAMKRVEEAKKMAEAMMQKAMKAQQGNTVPVKKESVWDRDKANEAVLKRLKRYGGLSAYGFDWVAKQHPGVGLKHTVISFLPVPYASGKHMLAVAFTVPEKHFDCHACVPKLSFFEFAQKEGEWRVVSEKVNATALGGWGEPPKPDSMSIVQMGSDVYGLRIDTAGGGQGYYLEYVSLFLIGDYRLVFDAETASSDAGTGNNRTDWKAQIEFVDSGAALYDILLKKKGKKDNRPVDERTVYTYNGSKYVKRQVQSLVATSQKKPQCIYFKVYGVQQLNIRNAPGGGRVVGRLKWNDEICVYAFSGKWARSDKGWVSRKFLNKDYVKNPLFADVDHDGREEKLTWECVQGCDVDIGKVYRLLLYDDDGSLLWKSSIKPSDPFHIFWGDGSNMPVLLQDIDGDGAVELLIGGQPHEAVSPGFTIARWNGQSFTVLKRGIDLVWVDAPYGRRLKWQKIKYPQRGKVWWAHTIEQLDEKKLPLLSVTGVSFPEVKIVFDKKAYVRFDKEGAEIVEWLK